MPIFQQTAAAKPVTTDWTNASLDPRWSPLTDLTLTWRPGQSPDEPGETLNFIRFTLAHCDAGIE